jgi:cytochrome c oxidase subunit 2
MSVPAALLPMHSVLQPAGAQAREILHLWHVTLAVCGVVFAAVLVVLVVALLERPRDDDAQAAPAALGGAAEGRANFSIASAVAASTLLLLFLIVASFLTDRAIARASIGDALAIDVTGYRWWWSARYGDVPSEAFTTANEIHVPTGRTILLRLRSADVIHSFWAPALQGKKDLIPGREAELRFEVDTPGVYRGQCAEFCGLEHATMAFEVVADPPSDYAAWVLRQRMSAATPDVADVRRGRDVFLATTCAVCHTVRGTDAAATAGPDLTHLASRRMIAAGTLPNDARSLKRWIRDPQAVKPGANMPPSELPDVDLDALVAWLETLR